MSNDHSQLTLKPKVYKRSLFDRLLPHANCLLCAEISKNGETLCDACLDLLPRLQHRCLRCALPLHSSESELLSCGRCQQHPPPLNACYAPLEYADPLKHLISRLKFSRQVNIADTLGRFFAAELAGTLNVMPDRIIPVPLHRKRLAERGFNQSVQLAKPIAALLDQPLDLRTLRRRRTTLPQTELSAKQRRLNVKDAFRVQRDVSGLHIALVDDVMTTGSTVYEIARLLLSQGASRVDAWVLARATL